MIWHFVGLRRLWPND